jgi:hypothetical protein
MPLGNMRSEVGLGNGADLTERGSAGSARSWCHCVVSGAFDSSERSSDAMLSSA